MASVPTVAANNMYCLARKTAAEHNERLNSREGAAEYLYIAPRTLAEYELYSQLVPPDVVLRMAEVYNAPELLTHYCAHECPVGRGRAHDVQLEPLERITVQLINTGYSLATVQEELVDITADGRVSDSEVPRLNAVLKSLDAISSTISALKLWAEKNLR